MIIRDIPLLCSAKFHHQQREHCSFCARYLVDHLDQADPFIDHFLMDDVFGKELKQQLEPHGVSLDKLRELLKKQVEEERLARDDPTAAAAKPKKLSPIDQLSAEQRRQLERSWMASAEMLGIALKPNVSKREMNLELVGRGACALQSHLSYLALFPERNARRTGVLE